MHLPTCYEGKISLALSVKGIDKMKKTHATLREAKVAAARSHGSISLAVAIIGNAASSQLRRRGAFADLL